MGLTSAENISVNEIYQPQAYYITNTEHFIHTAEVNRLYSLSLTYIQTSKFCR